MARPNYSALIDYLAKYDLDARRIPADSMNSAGFDYFPDAETTPIRLGTDMHIPREHRDWPEDGVYDEVVRLYNGGEYDIPKDEPLQEGELVKPEPEVKVQTPKTTAKRAPKAKPSE